MTGSFSDWDAVKLALLVVWGTLVCGGAFIAMFWLGSLAETAKQTHLYVRVVNTLHTRSTYFAGEDEFSRDYTRRTRDG